MNTVHKKDELKLLKRKRVSSIIPSRKKTKEGKYSCDDCKFETNNKRYLNKKMKSVKICLHNLDHNINIDKKIY